MPGGNPPLGAGTHYLDSSTIVTDVTDMIYEITPIDTPLFQLSGDGPADVAAPYHQWQSRSLVTYTANAQVEGFAYTFTSALRLPSRQANVLQILNKDIRVSNTNQAIQHYGIADLVADQATLQLKEMKTDCELALVRGTLVTGATNAARSMQGIIPMIGSAGTLFTNATAGTYSETHFNGMLENGWTLGAELRDALCDGRMKRVISSFTGNATKFIGADQQRVVNTVSVIESDFGPVNVHLSRVMPTVNSGATLGRSVLFVDKSHLKKAWLRQPQIRKTADIADSTDMIAVMELSLEWGNPYAHACQYNFVSPI